MEQLPQDTRLIERAYWLIKLRWIAIVGLSLTTVFASNVLDVSLQVVPLYCIVAVLTLYNTVSWLLLNRTLRADAGNISISAKKIINFQISADLLTLTVLLHYSGGIENPFIIYFIFHMIIAGIILPVVESYLYATLAAVLVVLMVLLEYSEILPHYCLRGFITQDLHDLHQDGFYIVITVLIFVTTLYFVVYMTNSISTQLRRQQEAYRQANIQLKQKDRIKDEYVSRITHDIKGHLAAIQGCLGVVVNKLVGALNESQADFINRAHNRTEKLTSFVTALLKLTQMRLSNKLVMESFPLKNTIDNALATVKTKVENRSITLNCNIEPSVDRIFGSQFSIEEIITNLLLNAIKYTPAKGTVEINAKDHDNYVLIEVVDTGIGIPEDEIDKIFDEFFRATNARKVEKDGTGLGLSIAKEIVQRHGGNIWVNSREGLGAKFSFTLHKSNFLK